jgi:excisionase family DNA binding protein
VSNSLKSSQTNGYSTMPQTKNGIVYYQTNEACRLAGISRATFFRWLKEGTIPDVKHKDRRGWRLFTDEDIENLKKEADKVISVETENRQLKLKLSEARKLY